MPFRCLFSDKKYLGLDFKPEVAGAIKHDLTEPLPFENDTQQAIIISEVLEHIPDPFSFLDEVNRVMRDSGFIYFSTPFAFPVHGSPFDFFRYTPFFYQLLEERYEWKIVKIRATNTILSTPLLTINQIILGVTAPHFFFYPVWLIINTLAVLIDTLVLVCPRHIKDKLQLSCPVGFSVLVKVKKAKNMS